MRFITTLILALTLSLTLSAEAKQHLIAIEFREAIEVDENEDRNLTALHRVTFEDESLDWTNHEEFEIGDIFEIRLDEAGSINVVVESVEQSEEHIAITGIFEGGVGWVQILFIDEKICVMISDYLEGEIYHIVYNEIERCYTLRITES